MGPMLELLQQLLATYGYAAVGLGVMLESMGVPLPGETLLLLGAAYAGAGHLSVWGVIVSAAAGAIVGDSLGYAIGRRGGRALLDRYGRVLHINPRHLARAEAFFARYGDKVVFFGRFIAVLRMFSAFLAGVHRMPYRRFFFFNAAGGILWALIFGLLGAALGSQWPLVARWAGRAGLLLAGLLLFLAAAGLLWRWTIQHEAGLRARWTALLVRPRILATRRRFASQIVFLQRRLSPHGYLGLHLTVGVSLIVAGGWLFGGITEDVLHHDPLVDVDGAVNRFLVAHAEPPFTAAMRLVAVAGSPLTILMAGGALLVGFAWRRCWYEASTLVIAASGVGLLDILLKALVGLSRPMAAEPLLTTTASSFPSGSAMVAVAFYGGLGFLAVRRAGSWSARVTVAVVAIVVVLVLGFSRMYLGVHYLSDVLGGWAAGFVWLVVTIAGVETIVRRREAAQEITPSTASRIS